MFLLSTCHVIVMKIGRSTALITVNTHIHSWQKHSVDTCLLWLQWRQESAALALQFV